MRAAARAHFTVLLSHLTHHGLRRSRRAPLGRFLTYSFAHITPRVFHGYLFTPHHACIARFIARDSGILPHSSCLPRASLRTYPLFLHAAGCSMLCAPTTVHSARTASLTPAYLLPLRASPPRIAILSPRTFAHALAHLTGPASHAAHAGLWFTAHSAPRAARACTLLPCAPPPPATAHAVPVSLRALYTNSGASPLPLYLALYKTPRSRCCAGSPHRALILVPYPFAVRCSIAGCARTLRACAARLTAFPLRSTAPGFLLHSPDVLSGLPLRAMPPRYGCYPDLSWSTTYLPPLLTSCHLFSSFLPPYSCLGSLYTSHTGTLCLPA